ncbi:hypothetical protein PybrP1_002358 [[Pythium] brassicae (nom. inval.)]|nr:hypothetical protein PybrP1_002358 [[Pythium] brassicae (nom. inval.)]
MTSPSSSAPLPADAAADAPDAEPKHISLNVRTLDHTTYPISIGSNASVLQLKELVALETGVVFARQRLIFRGRVLKNDQSIAAYALEDGHTLHLVARAESAVDLTSSAGDATTASAAGAPPPAAQQHSNDEPDPTLGAGGGASAAPHAVIGATIAVDGAGVNMPFLSSMIANIMTSAHGALPSGHIVFSDVDPGRAGDGHRASYAHFVTRPSGGGGTAAARREESRARRTRMDVSSSRALGVSSARTRGGGGATATGPATGGSVPSGLANLRARSEQLLATVRSSVENAEYDLMGLEEAQLETTGDTDAAFLQTQLTQLEILLEHFRSRVHLLPVALGELQRRSTTPSAPPQPTQPSVSAIVRTIDTLQNVGESVDILARLARYLFIRHNPGFTGGSLRLNEGDAVSDGARRAPGERRPASHRRRHASSRADGSRGSSTGGNALFSLLERMNESIRGVTTERTGSGSGTSLPADVQAPAAAPLPSLSSASPAAREASSGASVPLGFERRPPFSMANLGLPLGSMVFPISFTDLTASTNSWNLADLVSRVASEVPSSTLFSVLSGDPAAIHQVMAQVGYALVSGVDVPPVSRATIRTWSHAFTTELRQQLRSHGVPAHVLALVDAARQPRLVDNLVRPLEPFVPDLVDFFLRATSASRTAAFGASSADFLATMSRQFVRHLRTFVGGDSEAQRRVLQGLLESFGLDARLAAFAVANFLDWTDNRRRELEGADSAESGPASKRQRGS